MLEPNTIGVRTVESFDCKVNIHQDWEMNKDEDACSLDHSPDYTDITNAFEKTIQTIHMIPEISGWYGEYNISLSFNYKFYTYTDGSKSIEVQVIGDGIKNTYTFNNNDYETIVSA